MIKPRGWQADAVELFQEHDPLCFLLDVTPGAGKTIFAALAYKFLLDQGLVDFAIIVAPTTGVKGDADAGFLGDWFKASVELTSVLKDGRGRPRDFQGGIITYSQLPHIVSSIETWVKDGLRIFVVFDEIHHVREDAKWGIASERLAQCATKVLGMTGTLFRSDGCRISFVNYDTEGKAIADFTYGYRQAVRDGVCRPVEFITDDGIADFIRKDEYEKSCRISEAKGEQDARDVTRTIFRADADWMRAFIERADAALDEYRMIDRDAGGLTVCRPGTDEDAAERYLRQIAKLVGDATNDEAEVVSHEDPDANAKIESFRKSRQKWICAVRKITEGVDIKRLRVLVMAMRPTTELLFRQVVGRVVRVQNSKADPRERATVFIGKFPQLQEWASKHADEAIAGLAEADDLLKKREASDPGEAKDSNFVALRSQHENGGAISEYGEAYTAAEINAAERDKSEDQQLSYIPVTMLAYLRRKWGTVPDPLQAASVPLQIEKKDLRRKINKAARRLAIRRNPSEPNYAKVWDDLARLTGSRNIDDMMDNKPIEVMRQAQQLLDSWLGGKDVAA